MPMDSSPGRRRGDPSGCRSREPREEDTGHVTSTGMNMPMITWVSNAAEVMPAMRHAQGWVSKTDLRSQPRDYHRDRRFGARRAHFGDLEGREKCGFARGESQATGCKRRASAGGTHGEHGREECAQPVLKRDIRAYATAANGIVVMAGMRCVHGGVVTADFVKLLMSMNDL